MAFVTAKITKAPNAAPLIRSDVFRLLRAVATPAGRNPSSPGTYSVPHAAQVTAAGSRDPFAKLTPHAHTHPLTRAGLPTTSG
jgi:hypothetical protein